MEKYITVTPQKRKRSESMDDKKSVGNWWIEADDCDILRKMYLNFNENLDSDHRPLVVMGGWLYGVLGDPSHLIKTTSTSDWIKNIIKKLLNVSERDISIETDAPSGDFMDSEETQDFVVIMADYENESNLRYGDTVMKRNTCLSYWGSKIVSGGLIFFIDQVLPMYRKKVVNQIGQIGLFAPDFHRLRMITIFRKSPKPDNVPAVRLSPSCPHFSLPTDSLFIKLAVNYNTNDIFGIRPNLSCSDLLYGVWYIGNDYQNKSNYYGAYPASLLQRYDVILGTLFFKKEKKILHLFSGGLPKSPLYDRVDIKKQHGDIIGNAEQLSSFIPHQYEVIMADPPYSSADATIYGNDCLVDREKVLEQCSQVLFVGGILIWLDCITWLDINIPTNLKIIGVIPIVRSTNHRFRLVTIFMKH
jgi:hypothetical protein